VFRTQRLGWMFQVSIGAGCMFVFLAPLSSALPQEFAIGGLRVEHPWLRIPDEGENRASLFMLIHNNGDKPDKLLRVRSDKFGKTVLHAVTKNIVTPNGIVIPPHAAVLLGPGRPFVSLEEIRMMSPVGRICELTLVFEEAGELTIEATVEAPDAKGAQDADASERWEKARASRSKAAPLAPPLAPAATAESEAK
jgi:periplasmic copper chaperone A